MKFEGKLEIGGLAMIIGCHKPKNSWIIGKVVRVEALVDRGDDIGWLFPLTIGIGKCLEIEDGIAVCSGVRTGGATNGGHPILEDHIRIKRKYLMPLPPLDEKEIEEERELEMAE